MSSNARIETRPAPKLFDVVELVANNGARELDVGAVGTIVEQLPDDHVLVELAGTDGSSPTVRAIALADLVLRA